MPDHRAAPLSPLLAAAVSLLALTCRSDTTPPLAPLAPAPTSALPSPAFANAIVGGATLVGAGNIAVCDHHDRNTNDGATAALLNGIPGTVMALGDNAYPNGSSDNYSKCYAPTWGQQKARTSPAPGDIDYKTGGAAGYFGYFGAAAGAQGKGYYSYDLGDWHIVVLNSGIATAAGSLQEQWLRADLSASGKRCTLAYWHHPRFSSSGGNTAVGPLWDDLYAAGAEVVINAHYENYERFAPQTPSGAADADFGIRQFVVGTGGAGHNSFGATAPNSEVRNSSTYGVLQVTLSADGSGAYEWQFVPVAGGGGFTDSGSGSCHDPAPPPPPPPPPPPGGVVLVGAGDIASCSITSDEATAELLDTIPGTVFTLGDNAYPHGAAADFASCYNPTWGRHLARTRAVLGNHDYDLGNANAAFDYFGAAAGPRGLGYYSYNLGAWHVVVLNDNGGFVSYSAGSTQEQWLRADLAANTQRCILAMWHQPRFFSTTSTGATSASARKILWDDLYAAGADLILNGHQHDYERFAPQNPDGAADPTRGIREIIVGTGGDPMWAETIIAPNSEVRNTTFGVLKLTLSDSSYSWQFVPVAGKTFTDSGTGTCH